MGLGDHLATPSKIESPYPYTKDGKVFWDPAVLFPDPWQMIAAMATVTTRIEFMTGTYILPLRDTFTVVKALSTAAIISNNRVKFGAGVGWMAEEFALTGQPFEHRGSRADEMLDAMEKLMRGGMVEYHGHHVDFPLLQIAPVPTAPVPILIGGESDLAMRRAARWNGWIGAPVHVNQDLGKLTGAIERLTAARRKRGSEKEPFEVAVIVMQTPDLAFCRRLEALGITSILIAPWYAQGVPQSSIDHKRGTMEAFAETVITKMN